MACGICRQTGHNRSTCPQRVRSGPPLQRTPPSNSGPTPPAPVPPLQQMRDNARITSTDRARNRQSNSSRRVGRLWRKTIKNVINLKRYASIVSKWWNLDVELLDRRIYYPSWLKVKDLKGHPTDEITNYWKYRVWQCVEHFAGVRWPGQSAEMIPVYQCVRNSCLLLYRERNPPVEPPPDRSRKVNLVNLRDENYLIYWVLGDYMIQELDLMENDIRYIGLMLKGSTFPIKTMTGHRLYLVPHRLTREPPYHPKTDKEFFIEPYLQINIHDGTGEKIYIDDKDNLSELNKWKFNALKLDYLIKEVIKLGGKNNDVLECVLDLHDDIELGQVGEWTKDIAGIPSTFTNIT